MEAIESIIQAAFPEQPVPRTFFGDAEGPWQDMQEELATRIQGRTWTSVTLMDWRMVGPVPAFKGCMVPQAFAYYVPSFLVGVISEPESRDFALEAILPNNRWRKPRGEWWASFAAAFADTQRTAVRAFLAFERRAAAGASDLVGEELVSVAEDIWA